MKGNKLKLNWINSNVVFVDHQLPIEEAVAIMVGQAISSVLVTNSENEIVGIVTERDIVRKFTLLPVADKLTRSVSTIMSRPVRFVTLHHLNEQIIKLHTEQRLRHFPILSDKKALRGNVVGIVSITDFLKQFIETAPPGTFASRTIANPRLGVMAMPPYHAEYRQLFGQLGFQTFAIDDFHKFYRNLAGDLPNVLFDWDGYPLDQLKELIVLIKKYKGPCIFATSSPQLVTALRLHLSKEKHSIAIKPIDISYCHWLLTNKWPSLP